MKTITIDKQDIEISEESYNELKKSLLPKRWKPVEGERYYYVNYGECVEDDIWQSLNFDKWCWTTGNCFQIKEEAVAHLRKLKAITDVKDYCYDNDLVLDMDWESGEQLKYSIYYDHDTNSFDHECLCWSHNSLTLPFLKSREACEQVKKAKGKELRIIFNVE